ncbi:MAG TPA: biotin--[acetyl-CoA-carboxylase] ligase [Pirellulales bacterium]|jgi:BirA family biotin operon repressor/biotin-[acetyl-CoA-carboxylase] ligase
MLDLQPLLNSTFLAHAEHHLEIDSTQTRARTLAALADRGEIPLPALVVADVQTAGRGRGSNRWWTGQGSLAFSLLVDPQQFGFPRRAVPRLSLAVGVALVDALAARLADHPLGLHWPNDLYVGRAKLAGILVEVLPDGRHIIGIGLNSNNTMQAAPPELRESIATLLDLTGRQHDHVELLAAILENIEAVLQLLGHSDEVLGTRFDMLCRQHGEVLTVYQGETQTTGLCAGIGADGSLLLDTPQGRKAIQSGTLKQGGWREK